MTTKDLAFKCQDFGPKLWFVIESVGKMQTGLLQNCGAILVLGDWKWVAKLGSAVNQDVVGIHL